jgi:hypothetical protein
MRKLWQGSVVFAGLVLSLCVVVPSQMCSNLILPGGTATATAALASTPGPVPSPEEVGFSSQRLERIGETIQGSIDAGRIAGAVSLVAGHGRIAYFKAFGMADREAIKAHGRRKYLPDLLHEQASHHRRGDDVIRRRPLHPE